MDGAASILALTSLLLAFSSAAFADGCFWSGSCSTRWVGTCGVGRVKVDQSDDCHGLCPPPRYPPCHPFATHVLCCNEETPIASDECARYANRVEHGHHWMCCSDGTQATVTSHELKTGFCRSGAQLSIQPKSQEIFKWMVRDWSHCSASCGDGVRRRATHCVGSLEYSPKQLYYVNDTKCDASKMPLKEQACKARPCPKGEHMMHHREMNKHHRRHRHGLPLWAKFIVFTLTAIATSGLVFGAYVLYQRRKESTANHGFVYVMLDNYN